MFFSHPPAFAWSGLLVWSKKLQPLQVELGGTALPLAFVWAEKGDCLLQARAHNGGSSNQSEENFAILSLIIPKSWALDPIPV